MQNSVLYFAGSALVPILRADISAGASCHVHFRLIAVVTVGTFPHQLALILYHGNLSVKATGLTVVALCIQLGIHDVIVNITHYVKHRRDVVLHIGYFDIGDSTAGRQLLEL